MAADIEHMPVLFAVLKERATQAAGTLSGGEQEMPAIAHEGYVIQTGRS